MSFEMRETMKRLEEEVKDLALQVVSKCRCINKLQSENFKLKETIRRGKIEEV